MTDKQYIKIFPFISNQFITVTTVQGSGYKCPNDLGTGKHDIYFHRQRNDGYGPVMVTGRGDSIHIRNIKKIEFTKK